MYQILKKLLIIFLCLSLLSSFVFAGDLTILEGEEFNTFGNLTAADYGVSTVPWAATIRVGLYNYGDGPYQNFAISDSSPSSSVSSSSSLRFNEVHMVSVTCSFPAGTLVLTSNVPIFSGLSIRSGSAGVTLTQSGTSLSIVSDGSSSPITLVGNEFGSASTFDFSGSFTPAGSSGGGGGDNEYAGTGSMFGWTGNTLFTLRFVDGQHWYTNGSGSDRVGHLDVVVATTEAEMPGYYARTSMLAALTYQKWKWSIDSETGLPKFDVMQEQQGTWADMLYRTSVYNYYWGNKLWTNDVTGSWYGSISSDFSYLNYRVNQILSVLANDEDLAIKDSTTSERDWVKNYFNGSGDKADSDKYDKLNNTGSAFKDAFAGAPDSSIADGFTAVNDNSYEFWSQGVSDDINGNASSSSYSSRAPAYVPPEQRIVDAYSENWAQIVGGYYD